MYSNKHAFTRDRFYTPTAIPGTTRSCTSLSPGRIPLFVDGFCARQKQHSLLFTLLLDSPCLPLAFVVCEKNQNKQFYVKLRAQKLTQKGLATPCAED